MIKLDKKTIAGFVAVILVLAGFVYLLYANGFIGYFTDRQRLLNLIKEHRANAAFIFIGFQALQVVAAPVPGEATGFVGGMFFGTGWGMLYSTIGLTLGSWIAFMLARLAGRPLVGMVVKAETIKRYDYVMKHKGMFLAFLMFLVPGFPKDILCYLLGLGHMGQRDFLLVSTTGRLLGTTLLTLGGTLFRDKRYGALFTLLGVSLFLILLTMVYREAIERWFRGLRAAQHLKHRAGRAKLKRKDNND
jgi:uncharacterized membrane protein YdjX (TVP38/TMEM64 family)